MSRQEEGTLPSCSGSTRVALSPRRRRRLLFFKLGLLLASTLCALLLAEIAVRLGVVLLKRDALIQSDPRMGWMLRPNMRDQVRAGNGGQYRISTDKEGHRITRAFSEQPSASDPTVIMVGDSFIQSMAADDQNTFAWVLAHEMPVNVVNLGVLSFGTDQELICLESFLDAHPNLNVRDVVVFVCGNDFFDVQITSGFLGRSKPRFRLEGGRLDRGEFHLGLSDRLMDVSALYWLVKSKIAEHTASVPLEPVEGTDLVIACLGAMRDAATRRGARFHIVAHHLTKAAPVGDELWAEFVRRSGATDITEGLRASGGLDLVGYDHSHWNAAGHRRVAALVRELIEASAKKFPAPAPGAPE